jgi:phosphate transport system substrate-binding protein
LGGLFGSLLFDLCAIVTISDSSFTWLLVPAEFSDKSKLKAMKDLLQWMSTDGQKLTEQLQYAPLPKEVLAKEQAAFSKVD